MGFDHSRAKGLLMVSMNATMNAGSRVDDMVLAVQSLVACYEDWVNDPRTPLQPTVAFEDSLRNTADVVLNGDIPARCQELWVQVGRLKEEWNNYARGDRDRKGCPLPRFWSAFTAMRNALQQSVRAVPKRPEPVSVLLSQKVGYEQIAFHIYGHRGKGPFITAAGQPDIAKIHAEAEKPGSVIPADWVHPLQAEMMSDAVVRREHSLDTIMSADGGDTPSRIIDPASIESLLREGQYPDVIAKVKATTLKVVLAEAKRLGITPNVRPGFAEADDTADAVTVPGSISTADADAGDYSATSQSDSGPRDFRPIESGESQGDLDAKIVSMSTTLGAGEIAAALGVSPQKVGAVLREYRRSQSARAEGKA